ANGYVGNVALFPTADDCAILRAPAFSLPHRRQIAVLFVNQFISPKSPFGHGVAADGKKHGPSKTLIGYAFVLLRFSVFNQCSGSRRSGKGSRSVSAVMATDLQRRPGAQRQPTSSWRRSHGP